MAQVNQIVTNAGRPVNFIPNKVVAVSPHDTNTFAEGILYVGVAGNVKARPAGQADYVTFLNVAAGTFIPVYIIGVHTDTTSTNILVCY